MVEHDTTTDRATVPRGVLRGIDDLRAGRTASKAALREVLDGAD